MENDSQKLEIVETLINKVFVAHETNISPKKLIADFWPHISFQKQLDYLKELKKKKAIGNFKKASDCFYITNLNKSLLIKEQKELLKTAKPLSESIKKPGKLSFDESTGEILLGEEKCELPLKSIEYYIAKALFEHPMGAKLQEDDLIRYFDSEACKADSPSRVYDASRRINKKVAEKLNIKKLVEYKGANFWLKIE